MTDQFPSLLQRFFTDRLLGQLGASPHTIAGYRTTFRLLFGYVKSKHNKNPSDIRMEEIDATFVGSFLAYLEDRRGNVPRSRNNRLAAIRSFFRYVSLNEPAYSLHSQRILAIPTKRYVRATTEFLSEEETDALLAAPNMTRWIGRRDRALLLVAIQTGLRNSEITSLQCKHVHLAVGPHVRCLGKGRKMRCTPLRPGVTAVLKRWLSEQKGLPDHPVFPSARRGPLSSDAVQQIVARHVATASRVCPGLNGRRITPHVLRHTAAMNLLRSGVDLSVIALWLGHESTETTQIYLHADMEIKRRALAYSSDVDLTLEQQFQPSDPILSFLESL